MTRTTSASTNEPKQPDFHAWHVTNKGDKGFWTKVGAAWPHRDGKGLSLQLDVMPMNGRIVLRQPSVNTRRYSGRRVSACLQSGFIFERHGTFANQRFDRRKVSIRR